MFILIKHFSSPYFVIISATSSAQRSSTSSRSEGVEDFNTETLSGSFLSSIYFEFFFLTFFR